MLVSVHVLKVRSKSEGKMTNGRDVDRDASSL